VAYKDEKKSVRDEIKDIANSFWSFFVFHRRMAVMIGLIFMITGLYSFFTIPRESEPEVEIPVGIVSTTYQGASPQEVAEQVTFKLEQRIRSLENLSTMTSTSSEGVSLITVEFDASADIDDSIRKLKDKVDQAKSELPADADDPFVQEVSFSDRPIVTFSFFGDLAYEQLLDVVENVQEEIEKLGGVQSADIAGERDKHVLVAVNEDEMMQYGLDLQNISRAIRGYHLNSPVGNIEVDNLLYRVRIEAEQENVERVRNIPVKNQGGVIVYVKDVAEVTEEFKEAQTISRVSKGGEPSQQAISINIVKKTGANIIQTVDDTKAIIDEMQQNREIPEFVDYLTINDQSQFIRDDFNNLMGSAAQTIALIFIILLFALGFKEAFIGGISIPFTFFVAFTFIKQIDFTFNFLVLFSLILGLGLLVDATIVIMEGVHENLYKKKMKPVDAALKTIQTYRFPLISGMLTTVAAFVPMLMMSGIMGEFFKFIPITVSVVLISSLVIGLFFMPAYSVIFMHQVSSKSRKTKFDFKKIEKARGKFFHWLEVKYKKFLHYLLNHSRRRWGLFAVSLGGFIAALMLPITGLVKVEGFPLVDIDYMYIDVEAPVGITLDKLDPIVRQVETMLQEDTNIASYVVNLGMAGEGSVGPLGGGGVNNSHLATFSINFVDEEERSKKSYEIAESYKERVKTITGAEIKVPELRSGPPTGSAIQLRVFGDDYSVLKTISNDVQSKLESLGGEQVDDDLNTGTAEFTFDFSSPSQKALLQSYGLTVADVAGEMRTAVFSMTAATIKRGDEEIDIDVQRNWQGYRPSSIEQVRSLPVLNRQGEYIPLGQIAQPKIGASLTSIRHFDAEQAITVSADPGADQVPNDILAPLVEYMDTYDFPEGYSYRLTGGNEDTEQSFRDLFNAMGIGLLLIFLILITQFNSFRQPFVILMALPLSLIGVLLGFFVLQLNIGVATMIGIVSLTGIVINDAIILIDRINTNRREYDMKLREAIEEAGPARLQPIVITSVTTILGILPISLTDPFWLTLGMAIVFGMAFSTILTLVIIPIFYYATELGDEEKGKKP
jgi:multidrug efflux pump subunit AcrB